MLGEEGVCDEPRYGQLLRHLHASAGRQRTLVSPGKISSPSRIRRDLDTGAGELHFRLDARELQRFHRPGTRNSLHQPGRSKLPENALFWCVVGATRQARTDFHPHRSQGLGSTRQRVHRRWGDGSHRDLGFQPMERILSCPGRSVLRYVRRDHAWDLLMIARRDAYLSGSDITSPVSEPCRWGSGPVINPLPTHYHYETR